MSLIARRGGKIETYGYDLDNQLVGAHGLRLRELLPEDDFGPERLRHAEVHAIGNQFRYTVEDGAVEMTGPSVVIYSFNHIADVDVFHHDTPCGVAKRGPYHILTYWLEPEVPLDIVLHADRKPGRNRITRAKIVWEKG